MIDIFPQKLRQLREAKGWSQVDLGAFSGVDNSLIARYERGERIPTINKLYSLAKVLGVSSDYLIGLSDEEKETPGPNLSPDAWSAARLVENMDADTRKVALEILSALTRLKKPEG